MRVTVLGCGASTGVPLVGCGCPVCVSDNPKNKRLRVSVYVETEDVALLIDTSPDLRQQALSNGLKRVDAVLYTHDHSDHTHGVDDLRRFNAMQEGYIPVYGDKRTMESIQQRFAYAFRGYDTRYGWYKAALKPHIIRPYDVFSISGVEILPFNQVHGDIISLGYRIGDFAYSTDVNRLDDAAFEALKGVKLWVVDCQSYSKPYTHSYLEQTLEWIERVKPERAILTHIGHELEYEKLLAELPANVQPAYDGMRLEL